MEVIASFAYNLHIVISQEVILKYGNIAIISFTFPLRLCALRKIEPCEYTKKDRTVKVSNSRGNTRKRKHASCINFYLYILRGMLVKIKQK